MWYVNETLSACFLKKKVTNTAFATGADILNSFHVESIQHITFNNFLEHFLENLYISANLTNCCVFLRSICAKMQCGNTS